MNLSQEQRRKVQAAQSPQELGELARAEGVTITPEEARAHFAKLNPPPGELSDSELDAISGGGCGNSTTTPYPVGTYVGIIDSKSSTAGELIRCGGCQGTRFVVTKVVDYDTVWVECESL